MNNILTYENSIREKSEEISEILFGIIKDPCLSEDDVLTMLKDAIEISNSIKGSCLGIKIQVRKNDSSKKTDLARAKAVNDFDNIQYYATQAAGSFGGMEEYQKILNQIESVRNFLKND